MNARKLDENEVSSLIGKTVGPRAYQIDEYDAALAPFQPGDYGLVELGDDNRVTVRARLIRAAERRHLALSFLRRRGNVTELYFHVAQA